MINCFEFFNNIKRYKFRKKMYVGLVVNCGAKWILKMSAKMCTLRLTVKVRGARVSDLR
jgi:hypothetical protein